MVTWAGTRRARLAVAVLLVVLLLGGAGAAWRYQPLQQSGDLGLSEDMQVATVPEFEGGVHILRYHHGAYVSYAVTVRNAGPLPITVTGVTLPGEEERRLLQPVTAGLAGNGSPEAADMRALEPVSLAPGEQQQIVIQARFDNCEYYTERAIEIVDQQVVDFRVGGVPRTATVRFDHPMLVRSPTINRCEDRTLDRSDHRRTGP